MASDAKVDDLMAWRWALRGNYWFDQIKATETPLRIDDELTRRKQPAANMSSMRRTIGSIGLAAHHEKEQQQLECASPSFSSPPGRASATSPDMASVATLLAIKRRQARS